MDYVFPFFINNLTKSVDIMQTLCGLPTDTQSPHGDPKDRWGTVKYSRM
jgi:hypothetical protein